MEMINISKKHDWILIGGSWLVVQMIIFYFFGINDKEESLRYIAMASDWVRGRSDFRLYDIFYSGYIFIMYLIILVGLPVKSMWVVQMIFSGFALCCFYKILD
jgi:hypothetical protein